MNNLLLIPAVDALPAVQAMLDRTPDNVPPTTEELRELASLASRYVWASEALLRYAVALGWRRHTN